MVVSNAPACNDNIRDELRKSALWLISIFSWVPDDSNAVSFVDRFQLTEKLFDVAVDAKNRGLDEFVDEVRKLLIAWAFKAGKFDSEILVQAFFALATIDVARGLDGSQLIETLTDRLAGNNSIDQAKRDWAAEEILERSDTLGHGELTPSIIDYAMERTDPSKLRPLLQQIAHLLQSS